MTLTTDPVPPATIEVLWCPHCDRQLADLFRNRAHYRSADRRCPGQPLVLTYRLDPEPDVVLSTDTTRKEPAT